MRLFIRADSISFSKERIAELFLLSVFENLEMKTLT